MVVRKITYEVGNFEFDNLKDAENFEGYLNDFSDEQLNEIYLGYQAKIDYAVYANPDFTWKQMEQIRFGIEENLNVSLYANLDFNVLQMEQIRWGVTKES